MTSRRSASTVYQTDGAFGAAPVGFLQYVSGHAIKERNCRRSDKLYQQPLATTVLQRRPCQFDSGIHIARRERA